MSATKQVEVVERSSGEGGRLEQEQRLNSNPNQRQPLNQFQQVASTSKFKTTGCDYKGETPENFQDSIIDFPDLNAAEQDQKFVKLLN